MVYEAQCESCGHSFGLPSGSHGKKVRCPACDCPNQIEIAEDGSVKLHADAGAASGEAPTLVQPEESPQAGRSNSSPSGRPPEGDVPIFVLGLLGFMFCQILGIFAWTSYGSYEARCRAAGFEPSGLAQAGKILGIISVAILVLSLLLIPLFFIFALAAQA